MRIYVVDDERIIRVSLADELRDAGYEVYEFAHANAALMQMKELLPDIVITDLKMPDIDGVELLRRTKKFNKNICVILMTAYSTVSTAVETMKLGAYDYIEKPFDNEKVLLIINRVIELKSISTLVRYMFFILIYNIPIKNKTLAVIRIFLSISRYI